MRQSKLIVALVALGSAVPLAQDKLTFETVSVKPSAKGSSQPASLNYRSPDRVTIANAGISTLITFAFETKLSKIEGLPQWSQAARYDIAAKSEGRTTLAEKRAMLRSLLAERFRLRIHTESSEGDTYVLTVKNDGRLGPNLRPTSPACAAVAEERERYGFTELTCENPFQNVTGTFKFTAIRMSALADTISNIVRAPVADRTSLVGRFDIVLQTQTAITASPTEQREQPAIFTALQDQAGLKLEHQRGQVQKFVVEYVEPPLPD